MKRADFDFTLPDDRIASHPVEPRDAARLLHVNPNNAEQMFSNYIFRDLPELLTPGDILVINDSQVIPARLFGKKGDTSIEILLHKPDSVTARREHRDQQSNPTEPHNGSPHSGEHSLARDEEPTVWRAFLRPGKKAKLNDVIDIGGVLHATVLEKFPTGEVLLNFHTNEKGFFAALQKVGHTPLPPYIKRADEAADKQNYQTVYATHPGSVAAPTAGLHFTPELMGRLEAHGITLARVTLHVGAGTFQPVKVEEVSDHVMHSEWAELSAATAKAINQTRAAGGAIVAVGTTAMRTLESAADDDGVIHPFTAETDIFITPGYRFKAVDRLITNFHLPQSTLFMLVCAFCGTDCMQAAYQHAIDQGYRFYSYGDACLLDSAQQSGVSNRQYQPTTGD